MDELVRHCLRELSFDGDLDAVIFGENTLVGGFEPTERRYIFSSCDVSRLRDFIAEFYSHPSSPSSSQVQGQTVDGAFCAFVWAVIVQQPGVRVGTIPQGGGSTEVYIAPQASVVRRAKAKGELGVEEPAPATGLDIVSDAAVRPLEDLRGQYGDRLRIAVDPETTFAALTGSHIRPSRLTPMIYTGLQIITRGREHGISVLDMGKKSGYDQKTCFYIIKQLVELDLVLKLRQPGISNNFVVHKYFYERSPIWRQVVSEEKNAVSEEQARDDEDASEGEGYQEETKPLAPVYFDPIDSRHLSSMPLLRSRLTNLLKNCPHYMHTSNNLMLKIGFVNPTRTDRRFFRTRLRELIEQGFIERVQVPHANRQRFPEKKVPCVRLITEDTASQSQGEAMPIGEGEDDDFEEVETSHADDYTGLKTNVSLHKQIIDCLAEAGMKGMTLNELSAVLGDFDRRTIDLLLNRLEKDPPPAHLADLGIAQLAETHGRERRYKYYTVANYLALAEKERLEDRRYQDVDLSAVGGFFPVGEDAFYQDEEELRGHVSRISGARKEAASTGKAKAKQRVNPVLPDGTVKRGRPRKSVVVVDGEGEPKPTPAKKGRKRKRDETEGGDDASASASAVVPAEGSEGPPPKKKRSKAKNEGPPVAGLSQATPSVRKRGRPKKVVVDDTGTAQISLGLSLVEEEGSASQEPTLNQRRGKSPKIRIPGAPVAVQTDEPVSMASSPLSSLPPSPSTEVLPDNSLPEEHVPEGAPDIPPTVTNAPQPELPEFHSTNLRRSTRTPRVRNRGDSLSPIRSSSRQTRPSTSARLSVRPLRVQDSVQEDPLPSRLDRDAAQPPSTITNATARKQPEQESQLGAAALAGSNTIASPSTGGTVSGPSVSFQASTISDVVIDPALLQQDNSSLSVQSHSLITMTPEPEIIQTDQSPTLDGSKKRSQLEMPSASERRRKRTKSNDGTKFRSKGNLSHSRRENEILRLLEEANGILNMSSKDIYKAHAVLVEAITKVGGTASIPLGARIDKKTLDATLRDLETKGKVKVLTTSVPTLTGSTRLARVAYLPETTPDAVNAFLAEVGRSLQGHQSGPSFAKTVEEPIAYGGGSQKLALNRVSASGTRDATEDEIQEATIMDIAQLAEIFKLDDQTVRNVLLSEKNTVAQLYGYIVGKAARARALHTFTVQLFGDGTASSHIVSAEHRIIHISYFFTDIHISTYCSLVAVLQPSEELTELLQSPEGRGTPIGALPDSVRNALATTQSKSRSRIVSLLEMLQTIGLVSPLMSSESTTPVLPCTPSPGSQHPTAFDFVPPSPYTPSLCPLYWRFNDIAPIRLWALDEGLPPVWKMAPVTTTEQTAEFWSDLEKVSTDLIYAQDVLGSAPRSAGAASEDVVVAGKTLRRTISWSVVYNLSLYQTEYLRQFIDPATGNTPLQEETGREEWLSSVSWVVSASKDVVVEWFEKAHRRHLRDLRRVERGKGKGRRRAGAVTEDAELVLARRAAEAREQRERDWEEMVRRVHPGELSASAAQRVKRVKSRFMQGGKVGEKWEERIAEAIREASMVAERLLATARVPLFSAVPAAKPAAPLPVASGVQEKDVDELVASQGPRVEKNAITGRKTTRKGKEKATDEPPIKGKAPRRHRFLWNRDYDELVRDASVIIKARCRGPTRLDWGAVEQIFPAVPRNSVRQRLVHLKEIPGAETYLARLEDKWYELWLQHRGTDELPDPDPESATNFDLATHVKFLRKHIDKNAVRVGFVEVQTIQKVDLPASLEDIARDYDVVEKIQNAPPWDFMWIVVAEEAREKQFAHIAFTNEIGNMPPAPLYNSELLSVADAAVRMVLGSPNETYDPDAASQLLKALGEEPVRVTTTDLLNRGVLSKSIRDPMKSKPGRTLKISDSNLSSLGGPLPRDLFQDAVALEDLVVQQEGDAGEQSQEWPLLATDGDTAFLLELASENKVRFDVVTSHPQSMRASIDWNSKKADDDDIETAIRVRYVDLAGPHREASVPEPSEGPSGSGSDMVAAGAEMEVDGPSIPEHGKRTDGQPAFCRRVSNGLVDCDGCLEHAKSSLLREMSEMDSTLAEQILVALREAGSSGLGKEQLMGKFGSSFAAPALVSVVQRMTEASVPLAHWLGYGGVVLVSAAETRPWTVTVSDAHESERKFMIFPRRWLDVHGRKLHEVWEAGLRAVLGLVLLHPGISQAEIRWRLRSAYDRQELGEILQMLEDEGYLLPRVDGVRRTFEGGPADEREEKFTFWFLANGGRRWYQV